MQYTISYDNPASQFVNLSLKIKDISSKKLALQLPSWRPGRYTLQNFAKNIHQFEVVSAKNQAVPFQKVSKDRWEITTKGLESITVNYRYHARQMDAGGTWLDADQLYINWITCGLMVIGRENDPYTIKLSIPEDYQVATSLSQKGKKWLAKSFYELVDSPFIASSQLQHKTYKVANCKFHLWFMGNCKPNWEKTIRDFKAFTKVQIKAFGSFPTDEYHFMFQILPYRHYHGVEHKHSTVIVLGPDEDFHSEKMYQNLLGVSSHELYHTWNVTRLRAAEMVPYQFDQENYSRAGFILEGITTYFGDLMLRRGNVFNDDQYLQEFNTLLKRHYLNIGRSNYSLSDSSFDLWLDGYTAQEPRRVSSIYIKGALTAFVLDIELRRLTKNKYGLDELLRQMWDKYGKNEAGYQIQDYIDEVEHLVGQSMSNYFDQLIFGKSPMEKYLATSLDYLGYNFVKIPASKAHESLFGFRIAEKNSKLLIQSIAPESPAFHSLCLEDELVAINGKRASLENIDLLSQQSKKLKLDIFRNNCLRVIQLTANKDLFWNTYEAQNSNKISKRQLDNRQLWMTKHL